MILQCPQVIFNIFLNTEVEEHNLNGISKLLASIMCLGPMLRPIPREIVRG